MMEYPSSGKEPYVFFAEKPGDLLGVHSALIESSLQPDEPLLYLIYTPIWPGKKGPFGFSALPGSHALAVTKYRFIISENRHKQGIAPTVYSIPFHQVLYVQLGSALLLGWFSITAVSEGRPLETTFFFPAVTGIKHVSTATQKYRQTVAPGFAQYPPTSLDWASIWKRTPLLEVNHLVPLLLDEEVPFIMFRSSERWILIKKGWRTKPFYLSPNGIFIGTNFGFISVIEELPVGTQTYHFGVNISCFPFDALKSVQFLEKRIEEKNLPFFRLKLSRGNSIVDFDIPFNEESRREAEDFFDFMKIDKNLTNDEI